jgi:integrase
VPEAGNSLAAYLTGGRPSSASPCVFLSLHAPYEGVGRKACANALARVLGDLAEGCHGFHELRRTFATGMLRGGSGIGQIADALGHASEGSVRAYLSLDERRMRDCALPLSMLGGGGVR